ncbi:MAG: glutamate--tRNA ligase [Parcubacteria group bacterium]|nr:glutamate--tRNA ligase [Parcubacteria group bacterium]
MISDSKKIVTRFAPSPTGPFHVGAARTALFNFLFTRHHGGVFILRIEDTDSARSKKEYEEDILRGLSWLGIAYDELHRQSERTAEYRGSIERLLRDGTAYVSAEERDGATSDVIRFRNPNQPVTFNDAVRGEITFDTTELKDFVIARSVEEPLYNLAVVIDDGAMRVTHVIRGEDHISNTPRQILLQRALGLPQPIYVHIPLVLAPDRSKLSKRHGATSVSEYRDAGYLPEALVNFLALLGWSPQEGAGDEAAEIMSLGELIAHFDIDKIQKSGAIFNLEKLQWMNRQHIRRLPQEKLEQYVASFMPPDVASLPQYDPPRLARAASLIAERLKTFGDIRTMADAGELTFFFAAPPYPEPHKLAWRTASREETVRHLEEAAALLKNVADRDFIARTITAVLMPYAEEHGRGNVLWPVRYALSGKDRSPDPFTLAAALGKEETLARLSLAREALQK